MKLGFGEVLSESVEFFFARLRLFFHLVTVPWILSVVLRVAGAAVGEESLPIGLAEKALDAIPTVMFMVAWMRVVLLGPVRVDRLPGLGWSAREMAFLAHLLKVAGITFILSAAFLLTIGGIDPEQLRPGAPIDPELVRREAMAAPLGTGFIVSALLALRVSFGLAATAIDVPFTPRHSWSYSRGNAWTIIGVLFVIFFSSAIAIGIGAYLSAAILSGVADGDLGVRTIAWTVAMLISYAGTAIAATAQAIIFRRLTGWREGMPLPPPG